MTCAVATEEALGIEYDEQTACDVCRDVRTTTVVRPLLSQFVVMPVDMCRGDICMLHVDVHGR